jgi:hypothetical protein
MAPITAGSIWGGSDSRGRQRLALRIPIHVEYFTYSIGRLVSDAVTIQVSVHGAVLRLPWGAPIGRDLLVQNLDSLETQVVIVKSAEYVGEGNFDVAVEFSQVNPKFWGIAFPPED